MINFIKKSNLVLILVLISLFSKGQNLYDLEHSRQYANYLFQNQEYELAAKEYDRITFLA